MHSFWLINALLLLPLVGVALTVSLRAHATTAYRVAVSFASAELILSAVVTALYNWHSSGVVDFAHRSVLAAPLGVAYDVGIDGISLLLVLLTSLVVLLALVGARPERATTSYAAWMLLVTTATIGSFVSRDLLEFFLFFELTLIPSYFLIAQWGGAERSRAAIKFFIYTLLGSGFLLVGLIYLGYVHVVEFGGNVTFAISALSHVTLPHATAVWVFAAFAIAFAVKSPLWPFHTWSPLAYREAPIGGSMVLSALLAKLGTYGFLRFAVFLLPTALPTMRPVVLTLAVIGIVYGSGLAAVSKDMKTLVAYSSLAQVGFIIVGVMSGSQIATTGAVLLMFNHGVITAAFFLIIGFVEKRRGTFMLADLRGLQGPAPILAGLFTVVMLASIGLPGLSGFVSEYLVLIGTFATHPWWAVVASLGVVLSAVYLLWAYQQIFHGPATAENAGVSDASVRERWLLAPLVALIVVLGVYPTMATARIEPSVHSVIAHTDAKGVNQ